MLISALGSALSAIFLAGAAPQPAPSPAANPAANPAPSAAPETLHKAYATMSLLSAPPGKGELQKGFLASLHRQYPARECPSGFRSNLRKAPEVEICVSYTGFEGRCERLGDDSFSCRVAFTLRVASPTHPGVLDKLESTERVIERDDFRFTRDWRGWHWDAAPETVDGLVPAEFRGRSPFNRVEASN